MKTKRLITALLVTALLAVGIQQTRALVWIYYVCAAGGAAIIGTYTYFKVKSCKPKYYCMTDADGNRFYSNASRTERAANDWTITGGPYDSAEEAAAGCVTSTNRTANITSITAVMQAQTYTASSGPAIRSSGVDAVVVPSVQMTVWKSPDAKNWQVADRIMDDPDHFTWIDTNAISTSASMFYRVSVP